MFKKTVDFPVKPEHWFLVTWRYVSSPLVQRTVHGNHLTPSVTYFVPYLYLMKPGVFCSFSHSLCVCWLILFSLNPGSSSLPRDVQAQPLALSVLSSLSSLLSLSLSRPLLTSYLHISVISPERPYLIALKISFLPWTYHTKPGSSYHVSILLFSSSAFFSTCNFMCISFLYKLIVSFPHRSEVPS